MRSWSRSCASASRAGKLASARTLSLPRRLVPVVNVFRTRGCNATGYSHVTDRADRRRRDSSLRPTSGFALKRHAQKSAPDRARDRDDRCRSAVFPGSVRLSASVEGYGEARRSALRVKAVAGPDAKGGLTQAPPLRVPGQPSPTETLRA